LINLNLKLKALLERTNISLAYSSHLSGIRVSSYMAVPPTSSGHKNFRTQSPCKK
jgi:hypothetical protein